MKALLDECLPRRLRQELSGFEVHTVTSLNWDGEPDDTLLPQAVAM